MPIEPTKSKLTLIQCSRIALEEEIRRVMWTGTNEELHAVVEKMMPRGKLSLVARQEIVSPQSDSPDSTDTNQSIDGEP